MISAYGIAIGVEQRLLPYRAAIESALSVADEYCVVFDPRFDKEEIFTSIDPRVIPIRHHYDFMEWDFINIALTKARQSCSGDWCLYLELDEVLHEQDTNIYLHLIDCAIKNGSESISIPYLDIRQSNPVDHYKICGVRQKFSINAPYIYHKTSDYMIEICESPIWDGKYIKVGQFDDVSYYDARTNAWFNDPNTIIMDSIYIPYIWHYAFYNIERKHKQGMQNCIWQHRTYNLSNVDYSEQSMTDSFNQQIILEHNIEWDIEQLISDGLKPLPIYHPKYIELWIRKMLHGN